ncbi:MAG: AAA family ATPase [bacterium]|nr:AAA family ATPase [bacterium]
MTRKKKPLDLRSRYGFHTTPFTREIRADQHFRTPDYDEQVEALARAVDQRECAAFVAPAGSGKTTLMHGLLARLPEVRYCVRYVKETSLSRRDLCREVALAVGAQPAGSYPSLVRRLQDRFQGQVESEGVRPVIILDDAHELRPSALGLIKVLTNFEMDSRLVLSVLLVGQPPLRRALQRDDLEDVARRLVHIATLRLLARDETRQYVEHRCTIAGATSAPFDEPAFDALYELSRGNLRAIDRLALKALELAAARQRDLVETVHLTEARKLVCP